MLKHLMYCSLLTTLVLLGPIGCTAFSGTSSQGEAELANVRLQKISFADGAIEYTLSSESADIMRKIETVQSFNLNGNNQSELAEIELHRLFIATDTSGDRHISAEEAQAYFNQISGSYEYNLGQPSSGSRRR